MLATIGGWYDKLSEDSQKDQAKIEERKKQLTSGSSPEEKLEAAVAVLQKNKKIAEDTPIEQRTSQQKLLVTLDDDGIRRKAKRMIHQRPNR